MLKKLHVFMGLKDNVTELTATKVEMVAVYTMYVSLLAITLVVVNVG